MMSPTTMDLTVSSAMTAAFVALTALVVAMDVLLVRRAAPAATAQTWTQRAFVAALGWLALHAAIASTGVLEGAGPPPPIVFYLPPTLLIGLWVAFSRVGGRLASLPLGLLVASQAFRLPLEIWLHAAADAGAVPEQMTWSGSNFDVATGVSAVLLGAMALRAPLPRWLVALWNVMGLALLVTVVAIAVLSTPTVLRRFWNEPPVLLPYHAPFNWIVGVHVWTALVGHLVVFRALMRREAGGHA